jgi:hypothetical protein
MPYEEERKAELKKEIIRQLIIALSNNTYFIPGYSSIKELIAVAEDIAKEMESRGYL